MEFLSHTKEDKTAIADTLTSLGSLTGALKIHNLFFTNTGSVSAKDLPTDLTVRPSNIKVPPYLLGRHLKMPPFFYHTFEEPIETFFEKKIIWFEFKFYL